VEQGEERKQHKKMEYIIYRAGIISAKKWTDFDF